MAQYKRGRRRRCGMGVLVQQPSIARSLPRQATGRVRDPVRVGRPDQPGRLTPTTSLYRTQGGSEFQRELIVANTRDGLAAARARERNGGRKPKLSTAQAAHAQQLYDAGG